MDLSGVGYFHGCIPRSVAEDLLCNKPDGTFLLRKSLREIDTYVISVVASGKPLHYSIEKSEHTHLYSVSHGSEHNSPLLVCEHYMNDSNGLKTKLLYPVHNDIKKRSSTHSPQSSSTTSTSYEEFEWFHGYISREEDTRRLSNAYFLNKLNGMFLVRQKSDFKYVLSMVYLEKIHRYIINHDPETNFFYLDDRQKSLKFNSLEALLDFHKDHSPEVTGVKCSLTIPCRRSLSADDDVTENGKIKRLSSSASNLGRTMKKVAIDLAKELTAILPPNSVDADWSDTPSKLDNDSTTISLSRHSTLKRFSKKSMPKDSIGFHSPYRNFTGIPDQRTQIVPDLYIDKSRLLLLDELGSGHFGSVRLAECNIVGRSIPCAVKILSGMDIQSNRTELLKEAAVMQNLDHPFIVRLLAVCDPVSDDDGSLMIVLELAPLGSLKNYVKKQHEVTFPESKILLLMQQVCDGMAYLSHHNVVHRDLAARNILMVTENFVKISDFGMSRILHDSDYYKASKPGCWPLRWYAPEALHYYKFTSKGDVWSYGITIWEVCSYGNRPYRGMSGREVLNMLDCERRLECPASCSPGLYSVMLRCWAYDPEDRPTFQDLLFLIEDLLK